MTEKADKEVVRGVIRIHSRILAVVLALVFGFGLFLMTAWLVVKGGPDPGKHLVLLQNYFVGYSISWPGSIIGMFYGAALGAVIGWFMGLVYNWTAAFRK